MAIKLQAFNKSFRGGNKNIITASIMIEWEKPVFKDVIFMKILESFASDDASKSISIAMDSYKCRQILEGIKQLTLGEISEFDIQSGGGKKIVFVLSEKKYFINFYHDKKNISTPMDKRQILAMAGVLEDNIKLVLAQVMDLTIKREMKRVKDGDNGK